jgi:shikimate dehydrogenase
MGIQGQLTRVFADRIGSELAYACLPGKEAAPGQLDVVTQISMLEGPKRVFGLIGHPVSHSVSKPMQEAALSHLGLRGMYLPLDFPPKEFDGNALRALKNLGFEGLNVTIPHKGQAFKLCNRKGEFATATRAVNTISFKGKAVVGENTDVNGFSRLLDGKTTITRNTDALIIGAGGAARAVACVLSERRARLTIIDIEKSRSEALAKSFGAKSESVKRLWKSDKSFDLVVNCTPLKAGFVGPGSVFFDIIYNPPVTKAMELAAGRGAKAYGGLEMLVQQGAESFRLWTGLEPNVDAMRVAAGRALP